MPDTMQIVELGVAVTLIAGAFLWRFLARRRALTHLESLMTSQDPEVRRIAVEAIGAHGLHPYADLLLDRVTQERDSAVRAAVAGVVSRNQWEPADDPVLVTLRRWVRKEDGIPALSGAPALPFAIPLEAPEVRATELDPAPPLEWAAPEVTWRAPETEEASS